MVDGSEEGTSEIDRALASAPERLFFRRLLFSAEMWRSFVFCVGFSDSISDQCDKQERVRAIGNALKVRSMYLCFLVRTMGDTLVILEINSGFPIGANLRISSAVDGLLATDPNAGFDKSCRLSLVCRGPTQ